MGGSYETVSWASCIVYGDRLVTKESCCPNVRDLCWWWLFTSEREKDRLPLLFHFPLLSEVPLSPPSVTSMGLKSLVPTFCPFSFFRPLFGSQRLQTRPSERNCIQMRGIRKSWGIPRKRCRLTGTCEIVILYLKLIFGTETHYNN